MTTKGKKDRHGCQKKEYDNHDDEILSWLS